MEKLMTLLEKYGFRKRSSPPQTTIEEIENFIKYQLPEDYKAFLPFYEEFSGFVGE